MAGDSGHAAFRDRFPVSGAWADRVRTLFAGGASHDSWRLDPFAPVFVAAEGAWKTDIDGRSHIDFWCGHGSLLLGHRDPAVEAAVLAQLRRGTHFGGLSDASVRWAEAVQALVPSAERLRFTGSGSEAAQLAVRVARAFTGRMRILRLDGNYHGWLDPLLQGVAGQSAAGTGVAAAAGAVSFCHPEDLGQIEEELARGDVGGVILEPGGGGSGLLGWSAAWLRSLRQLTSRYGTLLIFDEVISGFRYAPGGVQALAGVVPDLTVLAKILSGGFPGGALAGRAEVMAVFGDGLARPGGHARVTHAGTFNGFPLAAAAGAATLARAASGAPQRAAERAAQRLCDGVNAEAERLGVDVALFRNSSTIHLLFGAKAAGVAPRPSAEAFACVAGAADAHAAARRALLAEGIDMHPTHGWVSAAHDDAVIDEAVARFARMLARLPRGLDSCRTICPDARCACRSRQIAGCALPLAVPLPDGVP